MIKKIKAAKLISAIFAMSAVFVLGGTIWAYAALKNASGPLILHFNNLSGITQIGSVYWLVSAGITATLAVAINFVLAIQLEPRSSFLARILVGGTLFLAFLTFVSFAAIISVN